jgi:cell division protein FtsW
MTTPTNSAPTHTPSTPPPESPARRFIAAHPLGTFHLLLGATILLLALGLVMVLSASSIVSLRLHGSVYTLAQRQALFAVIGVAAMLISSRLPLRAWRWAAWPSLIVAIGLLAAVILVGVEVSGQRNWIDIIGPFRLQPSEIAKLAVVIWAADLLARKESILDRWTHLLIPLLPVTGLILLLVLLGGDVGNSIILSAIIAGVLFAAGAPLRLFIALGAVAGVAIAGLTMAAPYRMSRFTSWLDPSADPLGEGWQLTQGQYALGTGGWWGVGLGASREKWGSLPEAHTDFIYSVIGEELGLVGTLIVLLLFGVIIFAAFRISQTSTDTFVRLASAGIGTWIAVQAIVNMGAVLGLLPITGVPLPLVSYGGSSLVPLLIGIGMLLSFARGQGRGIAAPPHNSDSLSQAS